MKLLHVDSSILGDNSASRQLTAAIVRHLGGEVVYRDLAAAPIGDLTGGEFLALQGVEPQDDEARAKVARSAEVLEEFLAADVVVIGAPMYNFGLPTQLKAWIDRLPVAGKTFRYTETGPEGLVHGKRVIIASTRGGIFSEGPMAAFDHQESYLRGAFPFLGVTDVTVIRAEGLGLSPENRAAVLETALAEIAQLPA